MFWDKINTCLGIIKIFMYKICFSKRIVLNGILKSKYNFKLCIDRKSMIKIGKNVKIRYNNIFRSERGR